MAQLSVIIVVSLPTGNNSVSVVVKVAIPWGTKWCRLDDYCVMDVMVIECDQIISMIFKTATFYSFRAYSYWL